MIDSSSAQGVSASIGAMSTNTVIDGSHKKVPPKFKFTPEEDALLAALVQKHGNKDWIHISQLMGTRNPRQCRERWNNYVNPELRRDAWTMEEDRLLDEKYAEYGPKWNKIARFFKNRSDNNIRNRWMMIARHRAKTGVPPTKPPQKVQTVLPVQLPRPSTVPPVAIPPRRNTVPVIPPVMPVVRTTTVPKVNTILDDPFDIPIPKVDGFDIFAEGLNFNDDEFSFLY